MPYSTRIFHSARFNIAHSTMPSLSPRGTPRRWPENLAMANRPMAPEMLAQARNTQGDTSLRPIFMTGQLRPQKIDRKPSRKSA